MANYHFIYPKLLVMIICFSVEKRHFVMDGGIPQCIILVDLGSYHLSSCRYWQGIRKMQNLHSLCALPNPLCFLEVSFVFAVVRLFQLHLYICSFIFKDDSRLVLSLQLSCYFNCTCIDVHLFLKMILFCLCWYGYFLKE